MKIGFDARMITHPGIGRYISCLLPEMIKQSPEDKFILFGDPEKLESISKEYDVRVIRWTAPIYSMGEQLFPLLKPTDIDILHVPHFNIPIFYGKKMVVTIHDLIYLLFPEAVSNPFAKHYANFMISSALKKAEKVITVSEYTKHDLSRLYGDNFTSKVNVIYEASSDVFKKVEDKTKIADVKCRYRLSENIILYVGSVKPHKNVAGLMKVFALLKKWGLPHQLVICGRWDKKEDAIKDKMSDHQVRYLGEIPTEDLVTIYSMADALVHLSLYEGFGLTILEAMQCGTPVVVSNTSSLPEVAGRAGFKANPLKIEETADIVYNVLVNKHLRSQMKDLGYDQVKQFSWENAAKQTLEVYHGG